MALTRLQKKLNQEVQQHSIASPLDPTVGLSPGTLSIITTDFGGDCDDQKAILQHISELKPNDNSFFIVNGPHPERAAEAIAQAYYANTRKYPVIALGQQFEKEKVPQEKIFSLINGEPIYKQKVVGFEAVTLEALRTKIDNEIKSGSVADLRQCVIGPLHADDEYYDPSSRLSLDPDLKEKWEKLPKSAVIQFQRSSDQSGNIKYSGNNFQKSKPDVSQKFNAMLSEQGYTRTYFEGAVAKDPVFLLSARQEKLPGIEKSIAAYMENLQVPWASMPGKSGTTPTREQMRVAMFTPKGEVPFGVHVAGAIPPGFGIERLAKEVCGIAPDTEEFAGLSKKIDQELDSLDDQVLQQLHKRRPDLAHMDVSEIRADMHSAMTGALHVFAEEKGISRNPNDFKDFFSSAKKNGINLNAFTYMNVFKKKLFEKNHTIKEVTSIAQEQAALPGRDGKSHLDKMTSILRSYGARAVMYDAVAFAAARTVEKSPLLAAYFTEADGARNITKIKVDALCKSRENVLKDIYKEFRDGVRSELTRDGAVLAISELNRNHAVPTKELTTAISLSRKRSVGDPFRDSENSAGQNAAEPGLLSKRSRLGDAAESSRSSKVRPNPRDRGNRQRGAGLDL